MASIQLTIEVDATHLSGKFASKAEMADSLQDELDGANPGMIYGIGVDGDSQYEITSWEVSHNE